MRRAAAALVAALLLVGACSDDGDGSDGGSDAGRETTTTELRFTGDPASPFCTVLREYQGGDALGQPAQTAEESEAAFTTVLDVLARVAAAAPPELAEDTALVLEGFAALDDALRPVGYDFQALERSPEGPAVAAAVNDPAFAVAGDRIEAYKDQVCGL